MSRKRLLLLKLNLTCLAYTEATICNIGFLSVEQITSPINISDNHMHNFTCAYKIPINFRTVTYANTISFSPDLFHNNKTKYLGASFALNKGNS